MRAVTYHRYGPPEVLAVEDLAAPEPGPGEFLVAVRAAAVTTADCAFRRGRPLATRAFGGWLRPGQPVLGTEMAGEVVAVGEGTCRFAVGDHVFAATGDRFAAHAEYLCLREDDAVARMPAGITHAQAAAICEGALTALPFLRDHGRIRAGNRVLVNGATGAVGVAAVQLARHFGAEVTGVCSTRNLDLARSLGAVRVIDYTRGDFADGEGGYDIVFDVAGKSSFGRARRVLAPGGTYLTPVLSVAALWQTWRTRNRRGHRAVLAFTGLRDAAAKVEDLEYARALVDSGELRAVVHHSFSMDEAAEAHRLVETGHKTGSAVLLLETQSV